MRLSTSFFCFDRSIKLEWRESAYTAPRDSRSHDIFRRGRRRLHRRWRARRRPPSETPLSTSSAFHRYTAPSPLPRLYRAPFHLLLPRRRWVWLFSRAVRAMCPPLAHGHGPPSSFLLLPVHPAHASSFFLSTAARTDPSSCCRSRAGDGSGCAWLG
jgi:hypothetical protein